MSTDEDQHDWIEETFRFEQKRAKFRIFLAQCEYDELNLIADDIKKMLDYRAHEIEVRQANKNWVNGEGFSILNSPVTYAPYKPGGSAA